MVILGGRNQITGIEVGSCPFLPFPIVIGIAFLIIDSCFLEPAQAKDFGTHGVIYAIEEEDPIALIQQKLKTMEESGELTERNRELQKKTRAAVERPQPVKNITKATKDRVFYYDPSYVVKEDFYDHQGHLFARKGMKINPLETVSLSQTLIFFDGDDEEQLIWAKEQLGSQKQDNFSIRLILTKGVPLNLAEELKRPIYFDQGGILTQKLGIKHVPALVSQEDKLLRIEEVKLPPSGELRAEGDV